VCLFKITDRKISVQIRPVSADCVGIDIDGVMGVAHCVRAECNVWTWYLLVASGIGQTGTDNGKCWVVLIFTVCAGLTYLLIQSLPP
jgi:hypothetical protein